MADAVVDELRAKVNGDVVAPGDAEYDEARKVYNGMIDKRPAAVVRCTGPADVATVIGAARAAGLDLSVRGGAHSAPGFGTNDGGLVVDLSPAGWLGVGAGVALCALSAGIVVTVDAKPDLQKADWRSVAELMDRNPRDSLVIIQHDSHLAGPLIRYFKSARVVGLGEPVRVQEIDLLYHFPPRVNRCGFFQGRDCETATFFFPLFPDALKTQFVYSGKLHVGDFVINEYRPQGTAVVSGGSFVPKPKPKKFAVILRRSRHGP